MEKTNTKATRLIFISKKEIYKSDLHITDKDIRIINLSNNTIMSDIDALIDNGFLKVTYHGKIARKPNIYGFSNMWRKYGTDDFFIHPNNKRLTKKNSYKG